MRTHLAKSAVAGVFTAALVAGGAGISEAAAPATAPTQHVTQHRDHRGDHRGDRDRVCHRTHGYWVKVVSFRHHHRMVHWYFVPGHFVCHIYK